MKKSKKTLIRIIVSFALLSAGLIVFRLTPLAAFREYAEGWEIGDFRFYAYVLPFLAAYVLVGYDVIFKAGRNLVSGRLLDENFLMTVATFGAIALCDFPEACGVMLFYQVGELFQSYAVGKSRKSIAALMDIRPPSACVLRGGEEITVSPEEVAVGETVIVRAGERVPVDGVVAEGRGSLDTSSLTGESMPREFSEGAEILSGSINLNGVIKIRATKVYEDSTVAKILNLVENAASRKAKTESFITKFARVYTPAVVAAAAVIALLPPFFAGNWATWINRGLTFLVVSCPCALVISVPLSFFGGIGAASKAGVLVKGGNYLELLAKADVFVFDKTGTLTEGSFGVTEIYPASNAAEVLRLAAIAESGSLHPIAQSIVRQAGRVDGDGYTITEVAGRGVKAEKNGETILAGNARFMEEEGISIPDRNSAGSIVYVAKKGTFVGFVVVSDRIKAGAKDAVNALKKEGATTFMLTGDNEGAAAPIAKNIGVDGYAAQLLPQDKVARVEKMISENKGGAVCFLGDGINDAPVLSVADVGVSMGGIGSDAAIEASDVVLMRDDPGSLLVARKVARKTVRIAKENVVFALAVKAAVLVVAALGLAGKYAMWLAVFADVGVAVIAILNAMRALRIK